MSDTNIKIPTNMPNDEIGLKFIKDIESGKGFEWNFEFNINDEKNINLYDIDVFKKEADSKLLITSNPPNLVGCPIIESILGYVLINEIIEETGIIKLKGIIFEKEYYDLLNNNTCKLAIYGVSAHRGQEIHRMQVLKLCGFYIKPLQ